VHFQRGPIKAPRDIDPAPQARALFHLEMMARGFYLSRRGYMTLSLVLGEDDFAGFTAAFDEFWQTYGHLLDGR
jgi:hypothetical protein